MVVFSEGLGCSKSFF